MLIILLKMATGSRPQSQRSLGRYDLETGRATFGPLGLKTTLGVDLDVERPTDPGGASRLEPWWDGDAESRPQSGIFADDETTTASRNFTVP